jgi:hypothetical protein
MDPTAPQKESIWSQITRLFRNGPIVRHRVASSSKMYEPQGTARAYKRELSSLYVNSLASYGQYERLARYGDYSEMEYTPEIASALDIYADEITAVDEHGWMIKLESENEEIKQVLETLFFDIINIEFNLHSWCRNLCKYGDFILFVDASESNGILNLLPIPINEIEREEGYDPKNPFAFRFRWLTQGNMILEAWQIIHFRLLGNDSFLPYGSSMIEAARRIWRQLILIEDAMLVYRIVRSPERRVFKIETGNVKPDDIPRFMDEIQTRFKRSKIIDQNTGRVDLRYNPLSVDEDYYIPVRDGKGSDISTLPGGQFTGDIEDVQYIQNKLFSALKVPKSYLGYEGDVGSKATLAQEDVRFSRTNQRIQKIVLSELTKICVIHLFLLGYRDEDLIDFEIKMANPSTIAEQQKLELWRSKLEIAGTAQEGMLDKEFIWKRIFGMSEKEVQELMDGQRADKLFQLELDAMVAPGTEDQEAAAGAGAVPGEEQLPTTLGATGGEEDPTDPPEESDDHKDDPTDDLLIDWDMQEDGDDVTGHNPGSEGDSAEISTVHGKDLFAPAEDLMTHVFGTEKQAASDPFDARSMRRMIGRPFSEEIEAESDPVSEFVQSSLRKTERVQEGLKSIDKLLSGIRLRKIRTS